MAFKAFEIATCLVAVGAVTMTITWNVKSALGVNDAQEFGQKMRIPFWSALRIYRPAATDEEHHDAYEVTPFEADVSWTCVEVEKRPKRVYDEGVSVVGTDCYAGG